MPADKPAADKPAADKPAADKPAVLAAADVPALGKRCVVALPVLARNGSFSLVRCDRPASTGSALCELHLIHLAALPAK